MSEIGRGAWRRRNQELRDAEVSPAGVHVAAFDATLADLELGPESAALVMYGRALARDLDAGRRVGSEYRLTVAALLELGGHDPETRAQVAERAALLKLVSTPQRPT